MIFINEIENFYFIFFFLGEILSFINSFQLLHSHVSYDHN